MVTKSQKRVLDDELARREADMFKAIAHPIRVKILHYLAAGPANAGDIAEAVDAERTNVSRHLAVLRGAGILHDRKQGLNVSYELAVPCILEAFLCCNRAIRQQIDADAKIRRKLQ
jgi:ArsR family transcriptional regulator